MERYKRKRTKEGELTHLLFQGFGTLVLVFIAVMSVRAAWGMYSKLIEASQGVDLANTQLSTLQFQEHSITAAVAELSSPEGVEAQIRNRYGVAKPGEGEIQIVENQAVAPTSTLGTESIWVRIWHAVAVW